MLSKFSIPEESEALDKTILGLLAQAEVHEGIAVTEASVLLPR